MIKDKEECPEAYLSKNPETKTSREVQFEAPNCNCQVITNMYREKKSLKGFIKVFENTIKTVCKILEWKDINWGNFQEKVLVTANWSFEISGIFCKEIIWWKVRSLPAQSKQHQSYKYPP